MKQLLLVFIHFYQKTGWFHQPIFKSLFLSDQACRFSPTCSVYCYRAIDKYGIIIGLWKCVNRISRCTPWQKGGYDPLK